MNKSRIDQFVHALILLGILLLFTGCASFYQNAKLDHYQPDSGYRFDNLNRGSNNTDSLFVVLSFSGGGTRAASFSYGVMEALRDTNIVWKGQTKRLLDEVDIISSVSGGSFTSAYYALHRDDLFNGTFESDFLKHDIEKELIKQAFSPGNWFKLGSSSYGRSDLAFDYYNKYIFKHATYQELIQKGTRPFTIINATDMTSAMQFPFIQDQFDLLYSNLSALPIARAVASSSAFPGLLTPLTFQNFSPVVQNQTPEKYDYTEPTWVRLAERDRRDSPERANLSEVRRSYYKPRPWARDRSYIHLIDGGVSDNIGLRGIMFALEGGDSSYSLQNRINREKIEKLVVIVVNAATNPKAKRDNKARVPGIIDVLMTSSIIPLDRYSFDTTRRCQEILSAYSSDKKRLQQCEELANAHMDKYCCKAPPLNVSDDLFGVDTYISHVAFDFIEDPEIRNQFKNLPTTFSLPSETVDALRTMGRDLLASDPNFMALVKDLH